MKNWSSYFSISRVGDAITPIEGNMQWRRKFITDSHNCFLAPVGQLVGIQKRSCNTCPTLMRETDKDN